MTKVRLLRTADVPDLLELSAQAGWNQTAGDWHRLLALSPDGCFGIEGSGRIVSSTTVIRYANEVAWIGMVLTGQSSRGQGNAKTLLKHAIDQIKAHKVGWAKLDATAEGRPIYAKLGFEDECAIERWQRPAGGPAVSATRVVADYVVDPSFDRAYFGAPRVALLNGLKNDGEAAFVPGFGYAMGRPGTRAVYFGPAVVRSREAASRLLEWFLARHKGSEVYWDLFPDNKDAVQLAIDYGFKPARTLTRMALRMMPAAPPMLRHNTGILAIAGFEYG
jgi:GNAT superfamily N-acetyltransferase